MANIQKNLIENLTNILKSDGYDGMINVTLGNEYSVSDIPESEATELSIIGYGTEKETLWKRIKLPKKKLVTPEYIINKLNSDKVYKSFASKFKKIIENTDLKDSFSIYPTTYGIGVHNIFNRKSNEIQDKIESLLDELNIQYTTEYSEAHWVFRFKISKSAENIERIKAI